MEAHTNVHIHQKEQKSIYRLFAATLPNSQMHFIFVAVLHQINAKGVKRNAAVICIVLAEENERMNIR